MSIHTGSTQVELLRWLLLSLAAVLRCTLSGYIKDSLGYGWIYAMCFSLYAGTESLEIELNSSLWDFNSCS